MAARFLRTSDLARELGVHVNTIRLYEASGFLAPVPRGINGYRQYSSIHPEQARLAHLALHFNREAVSILYLMQGGLLS